jgi:peptidoglycan/LPS O-acetylase OafA/YrhL
MTTAPAPSLSPAKPRVEWVDAARGMAAFVVLILHFFHVALIATAPQWLGHPLSAEQVDTLGDTLAISQIANLSFVKAMSWWIIGCWDLGKIGVLLFFMISGFVIPFSLMVPRQKPLLSFLVSRFFRLYPIYWISLLAMVGLAFPLIGRSFPSLFEIVANISMLQEFLRVPHINGVAWTLSIELIFYALCAGLFALGKLQTRSFIIGWLALLWMGSLGMASLKFFLHKPAPLMLPLGLGYMVLGYLSRSILSGESSPPMVSKKTFWLLFALTLLISLMTCLLGYSPDKWFRYCMTYSLAPFSFFAFYLWVQRPHSLFTTMGAISYSTYLLHPVVGAVIIHHMVQLNPNGYANEPFTLVFPIILAILSTLGLSYLTYNLIELPCIAYGRHWIKKINTSVNVKSFSGH